MKLTLPVKLLPSPEQHTALRATMHRFNAACDAIAEVAFRERCANKVALQKRVYYDIRQHFDLSAQLTIRAIGKVVDAYKRDRTVQPRFRPEGAVPYDERILSWKGLSHVSLLTLEGRCLIPVRFGSYQVGRLDRRKGQADLVLRNGAFFLYVTLDVPESDPVEVDDYLGVDLGIVNLAVDSDGTVYSGAEVERHRRTFAHRRRNLQRKGTKAAKRKLRRLSGKQARYQRDTNHCISKRVVASAKGTARAIAIEDLGGIRERITVRKRQRARHANWSFFQLRTFLDYKARLAGIPLLLVDPRYSSQECSRCGFISRANRPNQATFLCGSCAFALGADHNAALVLRNRARAVVNLPLVSSLSG